MDVITYSYHHLTNTLQWRHNGGGGVGVMASQITSLTIVYSIVCSGVDQRNHQSSASLAFVRGIHWWPVNSPHKKLVTRKMFPFDDVIMNKNIVKEGTEYRYDPHYFHRDGEVWLICCEFRVCTMFYIWRFMLYTTIFYIWRSITKPFGMCPFKLLNSIYTYVRFSKNVMIETVKKWQMTITKSQVITCPVTCGTKNLSIHKLRWYKRWSLVTDKYHTWVCAYLSMLGLKLSHVSKRGPSS